MNTAGYVSCFVFRRVPTQGRSGCLFGLSVLPVATRAEELPLLGLGSSKTRGSRHKTRQDMTRHTNNHLVGVSRPSTVDRSIEAPAGKEDMRYAICEASPTDHALRHATPRRAAPDHHIPNPVFYPSQNRVWLAACYAGSLAWAWAGGQVGS